ncbi:DUF2802 domain-containing protein [Ferrimonas senticii]|uniref:DUF2802 domain-containing protein n=1 Tax=Ferrimonas senticii TaxID=394566 RepID=UPI000487290E|nr:DUF2802 domain-containing protein [Ferrimonas senticii]
MSWLLPLCVCMLLMGLLALALRRWLAVKLGQYERKIEALKLLLKATQTQLESQQRELTELRSGAHGVGRRVQQLEQHQQQLRARQDEVLQTDPDAKLYNRAMKMVELGADVDEIIKECELPRAEAQLLVTLHRR